MYSDYKIVTEKITGNDSFSCSAVNKSSADNTNYFK